MSSEPSTKDKETPRPTQTLSRTTGVAEMTPLERQLAARLEQYDTVCDSSRELFTEKNNQYADSISRTGLLGAVVAIAGISARLEHLVLGAPDAGKSQEDAIVDDVKDLLNYAAIAGIMIMDKNWRPE